MPDLRITLAQVAIVGENKAENLRRFDEMIKPLSGMTDLVVFPELFTTGFGMNIHALAESNDGFTMSAVKKWSKEYGFAVAGSFIAGENGTCFNRGFFITPEGAAFFYDKRHLFTPGGEKNSFSAGNKRLIVRYNDWNIRLLICYDLRFPVWSRNVNNEYDLLIYPANWPAARQDVWDVLSVARALENQCFVCGVNRVGEDGMNLHYAGHSFLIDAKGRILSNIPENTAYLETISLNKEELDDFRRQFPVWKDADDFCIR
ncbi:MAG: nitrilase family protein [Candidatus Azobacteroides sp.]|nr:nitrilase family protein [Candidatus Azobacteroides sp.]